MTEELRFTVGAREIYDEVKGLRGEVQFALNNHKELKEDVDELAAEVGTLRRIVYGLVPLAGLAGYLINYIQGAG